MARGKRFFLGLVFTAALSFMAAFFYMMTIPLTEKHQEPVIIPQQPVVTTDTQVILKEVYETCQAYELNCLWESELVGPARSQLNHLSQKELEAKYPERAGWQVTWLQDRIILEQKKEGLCPEHRHYWHLAPDKERKLVGVYVGPGKLGTDSMMVKETDIMLVGLPIQLQQKIEQGHLEFRDWDELIAILDSLSEG